MKLFACFENFISMRIRLKWTKIYLFCFHCSIYLSALGDDNVDSFKRLSINCSKEQFSCNIGECVDLSVTCDGVRDCKDGSDETWNLCQNTSCPTYSFRCAYGACIDGNSKCNGRVDCADKSDELHSHCPPFVIPEVCKMDEFECNSGQCIDTSLVCDGISNCSDGSDEITSRCRNIICGAFSFRCDYGACIDRKYRCDGKTHCMDGSDESQQACKTNTVSVMPTTNPTYSTSKKYSTTTPRISTSSISNNRTDYCVLPSPSADKLFSVKCPAERSCFTNDGKSVKQFTTITFECQLGYQRENHQSNIYQSFCLERSWQPPIENCFKICDTLNPVNVDITCYRKGESVDCEGTLIPGTRVRPRCKPLYRKEFVPYYQEVICQPNGKWDYPLFTCIPECGRPYTNATTLIVQGIPTNYGDSPWHVAVYDTLNYILICGGTIISPYLIVSAAHCFYDRINDKAFDSHNFEVIVSKITRNHSIQDNEFQRPYKIREIRFSNKGYHGLLANYASDVALLVLTEKITLSPTVLPACVDWQQTERFHPEEGTPGKVVGWGIDDSGKKTGSEILLAATLPFISYEKCLKTVPESFKSYITADKFCAGSESGPGVRQGDSGGGLLFRSDSLYYIRGIVSIKDPSATSIAAFTDLTDHINWIVAVRNEIEEKVIKMETTLPLKSKN